MKIIIVGAGIGGLTAALCLTKVGHEVTLLEQAPSFREVGAGLQCGANALRVLDYLGLMERLEMFAVAPESAQFRDYRSGKSFYTLQLGADYKEKYGAPYYHIHRADLQQVLLEAVIAGSATNIEMNARVTRFEESDAGVSALLFDGRTLHGDCLIGADGIKSVIRDQLFGEQKPLLSGNVAWRAVVPVERLPNDWMETVVSNFVGPNKHAVVYYLRKQKLANLVGVVDNKSWKDRSSMAESSWTSVSPWQELKADFEGWHPIVQTLIDAMDMDQCYRWALYNQKPFSNWSSSRVTLLGDAAHATLPFMASGAAMAIEDARILQRALGQTDSISDGLQLYQRNRMPRTARIQTNSARLGKLYHIKNHFMRTAAFKAFGMVAPSQESFLPVYDANSIELV